ncbi:hypothetical protein [Rubritalea tangerina]|uniref:hypothetical protein n=1 Tax=Rubritalea tangerina TaxID=430798 RepID=UPI00360CB998
MGGQRLKVQELRLGERFGGVCVLLIWIRVRNLGLAKFLGSEAGEVEVAREAQGG